MATGVVREWRDEEGWGVLDSDETPGGCWAHFSVLQMAGYRSAVPGQKVVFTYEPGDQDGFGYRAVDVTIDGVPRVEPGGAPAGPGYQSRLTVEPD
jgi:cold shock protein